MRPPAPITPMRNVSFAPTIRVAESALSPEVIMKLRRVGLCMAPILAIQFRLRKALVSCAVLGVYGLALLFLLLLLLLLLFRLFDRFAKFCNCRNLRRLQRVLIYVAPRRRAVQRIACSPLINQEHVVRHACFKLRLGMGVARGRSLAAEPDAAIGRLHDPWPVIGRQSAYGGLDNFPRTLAQHDDQVGNSGI